MPAAWPREIMMGAPGMATRSDTAQGGSKGDVVV